MKVKRYLNAEEEENLTHKSEYEQYVNTKELVALNFNFQEPTIEQENDISQLILPPRRAPRRH